MSPSQTVSSLVPFAEEGSRFVGNSGGGGNASYYSSQTSDNVQECIHSQNIEHLCQVLKQSDLPSCSDNHMPICEIIDLVLMQFTRRQFKQSKSSLSRKWYTSPQLIFSAIAILSIAFLSAAGGYLLGAYQTYQIPNNLQAKLNNSSQPSTRHFKEPLGTPPPNLQAPTPWPELEIHQNCLAIAATVTAWAIEHGYSHPDIIFEHNDGLYADGEIGDYKFGTWAGGSAWFAAKLQRKWAVVHVGQDVPRCSEISRYKLPPNVLKNWLGGYGEY